MGWGWAGQFFALGWGVGWGSGAGGWAAGPSLTCPRRCLGGAAALSSRGGLRSVRSTMPERCKDSSSDIPNSSTNQAVADCQNRPLLSKLKCPMNPKPLNPCFVLPLFPDQLLDHSKNHDGTWSP